ncbi:MAG TPA: thiamine-phosphate kinase [Woeseiaceae bacterium]|nr:thiamine-phosphate kinase [Woeseiaceae bacterium]
MDEFELIRRYFVRPGEAGGVLVGIGDDGAVLETSKGRALVSVVDTLVEGVHWPAELPPADVGFRALAVNVSDVAAMGGWPCWMTLALTLAETDERWLGEFAAGLFEAAEQYGTALVGGDVTRGAQTVVSVQVTGEVDPDHVLTRAGASPGDGLYVTGTTGDAAAGLKLLRTRGQESEADREYLIARFARPRVPLDFAASLARIASAAIDVSDGLYADAAKLLAASGEGGVIEVTALPVSGALARLYPEPERLPLLLSGGDDYELCFTADPSVEAEILEAGKRHDVRVSRIGRVDEGNRLAAVRDGVEIEFADPGYRHFS